MYFAPRQQLSALEISGAESAEFLNDLLTAQIAKLEVGAAQAACLLSPQGRILFDMLVFRPEPDKFWLQLPLSEVPDFCKRLMMYRLRRPVGIEICSDWASNILFIETQSDSDLPEIGFLDPRDAALGRHIVGVSAANMPDTITEVEESRWDKLRINRNVPEGPVDLIRNRALMLEAGFEHLNAVDFSKGCYIGQEVTARTHYRGLVKKRILTVRCPTGGLEPEMQISHKDVVIGQTLSCAADGTMALAILRLDAVKAHFEAGSHLTADTAEITIHYPAHLPEIRFPE